MNARPLWLLLGFGCLAAGAAGAVLPLVPTTPFLLLAAFAFARSSPRLHDWLLAHPHFGPLIDNWRRHGAIGRRAKILAVAVMAFAFAFSIALGAGAWPLVLQALVLGGAALFVLTRPDAP
ncbi:YbaN family protein [Amphiplicatus metriothermophilus]|nr:YbaN family protein [Amphiplicatus metriothermophilus]MBB5518456.1 hypothetical protein [Amphiplicatus metriothermophilus]